MRVLGFLFCLLVVACQMPVDLASSIPVGSTIVADDTFVGTMWPDTPAMRNKQECYIEERGTLTIRNIRHNYPDRFGKSLVSYVVVEFTPPMNPTHTNTCKGVTLLWAEEDAVANILKRKQAAQAQVPK